jgi:hypothetical protein
MQKKPDTFAAAFNAFFTTQRLIKIIVILSVIVVMQAIKDFG